MSVYFAEAGPYIKIGYSADPISRVSTITTSGTRPADLPRKAEASLIGWLPGERKEERDWHQFFSHQRVEGEWFTLDREVIEDLIWADPHGISVRRMSAVAVLVACKHPNLTREQMALLGVRVEAAPEAEFLKSFGDALFAARPKAAS